MDRMNRVGSIWPAGKKCAVVLSFDLDAETLWLARDPRNAKRPVLLSMGRFGPRRAVPDILALLDGRRLPATFFIPGWTAEHHQPAVEAIVAAGHEVALHGYLHERPDRLPPEEERAIMERSIAVLEGITGKRPTGYRSPAAEFSEVTLDLLHEYGLRYSSNMMDDYIPYFHRRRDGRQGLVELPIHWVLDDAPYFLPTRTMLDNRAVLSIWQEEFAALYERGGLYMLICHPQLIGRPGRLEMLGELLGYLMERPDAWFARADEVAAHWETRG